jgi:hypothetical protein
MMMMMLLQRSRNKTIEKLPASLVRARAVPMQYRYDVRATNKPKAERPAAAFEQNHIIAPVNYRLYCNRSHHSILTNMSRRIHRSGAPGDASSSSSSEEEDAFTALSRRKSKKRRVVAAEDACIAPESSQVETTGGHTAAVVLARQDASAARKQKLDALVEELLETSQSIPLDATAKGERRAAVRGSFVLPGEEHLTTNVFVGNLPPSITEEEVGQLFSQFGTIPVVIHASIAALGPEIQKMLYDRSHTIQYLDSYCTLYVD